MRLRGCAGGRLQSLAQGPFASCCVRGEVAHDQQLTRENEPHESRDAAERHVIKLLHAPIVMSLLAVSTTLALYDLYVLISALATG